MNCLILNQQLNELLERGGSMQDSTISGLSAGELFTSLKIANKFEQLWENFADIILVLDQLGNILYLNKTGHTLLGYSEYALLGKNWFDSCIPENSKVSTKEFFLSIIRNDLSTLELENYENMVATREGKQLLILWRNIVLYDDQKERIGIFSIGNDITNYRKTEETLSISLAKYKTLFECFPLGIAVTDAKGKILETNPISEKLLGIYCEEHNSRCIDSQEWKIVKRDMSPMEPSEYASVRALREMKPIHNVEMGIVKNDHSISWVSVNAAPIDLDNYGVVITYGDITTNIRTENILLARERLREFSVNHSLDELLQKLLDEAELLTNSSIGFAHFLEEDQTTLVLQTWSTNTLAHMCEAPGKGLHYNVDEAGVWVECVHTKVPTIHNDYYHMPNKKGLPPGHARIIREMVIPIIRDDKIVAIIGVGNKPTLYTEVDIESVLQLSNLVWDIIWQKKSELALKELTMELKASLEREKLLANTDCLTNVFNRRRLLELAQHEMSVAERYQHPLSVLLFDLDHFKQINDQYGHSVGDQVLVEVAAIVQSLLRHADVIGRLGGEEFVVLLPMTHSQQAFALAERIREKINETVISTTNSNETNTDVHVTVSIGIYEYFASEVVQSVEKIIREADKAMYLAKQKGRNCTVMIESN